MFFCCVVELVPQALRAAHHPPASQQHHRHLQICLHLPLQSQVNKLSPPSFQILTMRCNISVISCVQTIILYSLTFINMPWVVLMVLWKHGQKTSSPCICLKSIDLSLASFVDPDSNDPWVRIRILHPDPDSESKQAAHKNNMKKIVCVEELDVLFARPEACGVW